MVRLTAQERQPVCALSVTQQLRLYRRRRCHYTGEIVNRRIVIII